MRNGKINVHDEIVGCGYISVSGTAEGKPLYCHNVGSGLVFTFHFTSSCQLQMPWCQTSTRPSATTMMTRLWLQYRMDYILQHTYRFTAIKQTRFDRIQEVGAPIHDDVIKWKHFPRYWPFVRGIHRSPVNSPHKVQWRGALRFSLICAWINAWVNSR